MEANTEIQRLVKELTEYAAPRPFVLGVSGGIDSAVVLALAARTGRKVRPIFIDIYSDKVDFLDAEDTVKNVRKKYPNVEALQIMNCNSIFQSMIDEFKVRKFNDDSDYEYMDVIDYNSTPFQNIKSRIRMVALRFYGNLENGIVLGTGNICEWYTGYFTRGGDGECDVSPILHLFKSDVREMAKAMKLPIRVINKPPSAGLYRGQCDESDLGVTYDEIEAHLTRKKKSKAVQAIIDRTDFKRNPPKTFGSLKLLSEV